MRRHAAWLVTLPLALCGIEGAHALANALVGGPPGEVFESAATGREALPLAVAVLVALLAAGVASRAAGLWSGPGRTRLVAAPFALLSPLGFLLLELGELLFAHEHPLPLAPLAAGVALQLPVAVLGYLLARALLRLGDEVRRLLAGCAPRRAAGHEAPPGPAEALRRRSWSPQTPRERGPPLAAARPG